MNDVADTRPLALGYLREHFLMTVGELARARGQLVQFAAAEGLTLHAIYTERLETDPAAFHALVDAARRDDISVVIVHKLQHLNTRSDGPTRREHLEHCTGVRVVAVDPPD